MNTIRLAIIDRQPIFLEGLSYVLNKISGMEVAVTSQTAKEMFAQLKRGAVHVLLTDISFAQEGGVKIVSEFKERYPRLKVIALSSYKQRKLAENIIENGGDGYILKSTTKEELITGIRQVIQGKTYIDTNIRIAVQSGDIDYTLSLAARNQFLKEYNLTRREVDIISLISQSYSNKEIAEILHISEFTVKAHRRNVKAKLHLSDTVEIVRFAFQAGITLY